MTRSAGTTRKTTDVLSIENAAHTLADRLPDLMLEARRVAITVEHGIHGRHRAGPGETFWQFRHYQNEDASNQIDWRRSGSSDHLFIREREWEASHTIWLWSDLSPSMNFQSSLSKISKYDRALILIFAIGELLVRGGERIAMLGILPPTAHRRAIQHMARAVLDDLASDVPHQSLPPEATLNKFSEAVFLSDFLEPLDELEKRLTFFAAQGVKGHLLQIFDPAEETLPYEGRTLFEGIETRDTMLAERAENLRGTYAERLKEHRGKIRDLARKLQWTFAVHHTDRPAEEALLALHTRVSGDIANYRNRSSSHERTQTKHGQSRPGHVA